MQDILKQLGTKERKTALERSGTFQPNPLLYWDFYRGVLFSHKNITKLLTYTIKYGYTAEATP